MAPCSANAYGRYLMFWPRPGFKITDCDLESAASFRVSSNMKSSGKRSPLRLIAWLIAGRAVFDHRSQAPIPHQKNVRRHEECASVLSVGEYDGGGNLIGSPRPVPGALAHTTGSSLPADLDAGSSGARAANA